MSMLLEVIKTIPRVIFRVAAILSVLVAGFWFWFWWRNEWVWWRQLENPATGPHVALLLLAGGWLLLALFFFWMQRRVNAV